MAAPAALRRLFLLLGVGLTVAAGAVKEAAPGGNCGCGASRGRGDEREEAARRYSAAANGGRSSGRGPVSGGRRLGREPGCSPRGGREARSRGAAFSGRLLSDPPSLSPRNRVPHCLISTVLNAAGDGDPSAPRAVRAGHHRSLENKLFLISGLLTPSALLRETWSVMGNGVLKGTDLGVSPWVSP